MFLPMRALASGDFVNFEALHSVHVCKYHNVCYVGVFVYASDRLGYNWCCEKKMCF